MMQADSQVKTDLDNRTRFGLLTLVFMGAVVLPAILVATGLGEQGGYETSLFITFMVPALLSFVGYIVMLSVRRPAPVTAWAILLRVIAAALLLIPTLLCEYWCCLSLYGE